LVASESTIVPYGEFSTIPKAAAGTDTVVLGHYSVPKTFEGVGKISVNTLENTLLPAAEQLGGRTLSSFPGEISAIAPELYKADRIVFFTSEGMTGLTAREMALIQSDATLMQKTIFVVGGL